ncbi:MAG: ChbG/HpnK family deacetylase [Chloroflexi bacterium]|nr:MAG: ChbG/HpnK family deacetylase [Chloroflexota bacterium]
MRRQDVHGRSGQGPLRQTAPQRVRVRCRSPVPGTARGLPSARDPIRPPAARRDAHRFSRRHPAHVARPLPHPGERDARGLRPVTLVITADDLGLSPGVTRGVLESHRRGVVRSTSLIVTTDSSAEAAALARMEPDLEVGLHIDLVEGWPVSDPSAVRSLVDAEGRFLGLAELTRRLFSRRVRAGELAAEVRAQAALARSWGILPLAWDSHRHVHLMPPVARVVGRVARDEGVRWIRRARAPRAWSGPKQTALRAASFVSGLAFRGIPGNRWYVDITSERPRLDAAGVALLAAYGGVGEIGAHPGDADDELSGSDPLAAARPRDLDVLTDPLLRTALGSEAVRWRVP